MNRRDRIVTALSHREPDRVPVDLGGMDSTCIHGIAYIKLKQKIGVTGGKTQIYDPIQQVAKVETAVLDAIGADVMPVIMEPKKWKKGVLPDGSPCEIPEKWNIVRRQGKHVAVANDGTDVAVMPDGAFYFEPVGAPYANVQTPADIEKNPSPIRSADWPFFADETFADLEVKARKLHETTDFALMGNFCAHIFAGAQGLRGFARFMEDLVLNPALAECIMDKLAEEFIRRFDAYNKSVGKYVQVINVNDDLGSQEAPLLSPKLYKRLVKPYHAKLWRHIKKTWNGKLFLHSDGSIYKLIPDLIDAGIDILNPVQYTAKDMDAKRLKKEFGKDLTFWGGGCDTQRVLPYGTPAEVRDEVKKQIDILAPGGGFIFCQVHNIQHDVPPDNIAEMYEAIREYGK